MKKPQAEAIFKGRRNGDKLYAAYGPSYFGDRIIWEAFVLDSKDEYQGRYILTGPNGSHEVYDDFQALMLDIGKLYGTASAERLKQVMLVLVPAFTFVAAIFICGYLVLFRQDYSAWAAAFMFFCIIASACALYFGKFIQPRIPSMP